MLALPKKKRLTVRALRLIQAIGLLAGSAIQRPHLGVRLREQRGLAQRDHRLTALPALLRATDELYRDDRVSDDTWTALAKGLDTKQLLDVLIAVGGYRSTSMAINSAGVQLDPNMADFRFPPSLR